MGTINQISVDLFNACLNIQFAPDHCRFHHIQLTRVVIEDKPGIDGIHR